MKKFNINYMNTVMTKKKCYFQASALRLWYNKTLKEVIDKPRIYHQLMPMQVQYEYGTTRVEYKYNRFIYNILLFMSCFQFFRV